MNSFLYSIEYNDFPCRSVSNIAFFFVRAYLDTNENLMDLSCRFRIYSAGYDGVMINIRH